MTKPVCEICGDIATCLGRYEENEGPDEYACDNCCGHGNEDGYCKPVPDNEGKIPRPPGCTCHQEVGDSSCKVHPNDEDEAPADVKSQAATPAATLDLDCHVDAAPLVQSLMSPDRDMQWALRQLKKHPTFTLETCQTEAGDLFWRAWRAFTDWERRRRDPHDLEVPAELKSSPGFAGIQQQINHHQFRHRCVADRTCERCGCACKHHEIDGPCFCQYVLLSFNLPEMRMVDGMYVPPGRDVLGYRYCNCQGFV